MAVDGAKLLYPIFEKSGGKTGYISIQTNTKYYRNADKMVAIVRGVMVNGEHIGYGKQGRENPAPT